MKKLALAVVVVIVSLVSCERARDLLNRVPIPPGVDTSSYFTKDTICHVIAQSGSYIEAEPRSQMFGFRKVINSETGLVDSLITARGGIFEVDSFFYEFAYLDSNVVQTHVVIKTYNRLNTEGIWQFENANIFDSYIRLDSNGNIMSDGSEFDAFIRFNYENGRLVSVDNLTTVPPFERTNFTYDNAGNVIKVMTGDDRINSSETFEYDYSRSAVSQIYTPITSYHAYEIMGWLPVSPKNLRTKHIKVNHFTFEDMTTRDDIITIGYSNHVINEFGVLQSFDAHIGEIDLDTTITNTVDCSVVNNPRLPL